METKFNVLDTVYWVDVEIDTGLVFVRIHEDKVAEIHINASECETYRTRTVTSHEFIKEKLFRTHEEAKASVVQTLKEHVEEVKKKIEELENSQDFCPLDR